VAGREREWELLVDFLADPAPTMRLGIVSGRRRHGRSHLLRVLQSPRARIAVLGEAKATAARRGTGDLQRFERIRSLLADQGHDTTPTTLARYSLHGFRADLIEAAATRDDILLVDLPTLYG